MSDLDLFTGLLDHLVVAVLTNYSTGVTIH